MARSERLERGCHTEQEGHDKTSLKSRWNEKGRPTWNVDKVATGWILSEMRNSKGAPTRGRGPVIDKPAARSGHGDESAPASKTDEVVILIPVFNDWESLALLLPKLDAVLAAHFLSVDVLVVDDGSTVEPESELTSVGVLSRAPDRRFAAPPQPGASASNRPWSCLRRRLPASRSGRGHGRRRRG